MNLPSKAALSPGAKAFLAVAMIIGIVNAVDFVFYGHEARNLLAAAGFALMGYGVYRNGFGKPRVTPPGAAALDRGGRYATVVGLAFGLTSMVMDYLP